MGQCKVCRKCFSVTSGTLFAFHKMPLRNYLAAIAIFCNEVKGKERPRTFPSSRCAIQDKFRFGTQAA